MSERDEGLPEEVKPKDARKLAGTGEALIVDTRAAEEFADNRPATAIHIDDDTAIETIETALEERHRGAVLVVTEDGDGADELLGKIRDAGHDAAPIKGGWKAWLSDDMPVEPRSDEEYEGPTLKQPGA